MQQFEPPLLLDEVKYAPNLFPELKKTIDQIKLKNVLQSSHVQLPDVMYRLTGSNQILMDKNVKESLAGRASYFHLNTLSVHEIINALPNTTLKEIIFKGGWPELYTNHSLSVTQYLNNYIRNYGKDWEVFFARTKDGQEVDFIIKTASGVYHLFEVKYAIHGVTRSVACPPAFKTEFGKEARLVVITSGGERLQLSRDCMVMPIMQLHDYLHEIAGES